MGLTIHIYFFLSVWEKGDSWTYWRYVNPVTVNMGPSQGKVTEESDCFWKPWIEKLNQNFSAALQLSPFLKWDRKKKKKGEEENEYSNILGLFSP